MFSKQRSQKEIHTKLQKSTKFSALPQLPFYRQALFHQRSHGFPLRALPAKVDVQEQSASREARQFDVQHDLE